MKLKADYTCKPFSNVLGDLAVRVTFPTGTRCQLIKGLIGGQQDGYVIADISLIIRLTGNAHDPKYRYVCVPDEFVEN